MARVCKTTEREKCMDECMSSRARILKDTIRRRKALQQEAPRMHYWEPKPRPSGKTWRTTRHSIRSTYPYPAQWTYTPGVPGYPDALPSGRAALRRLLASCEQTGPFTYRLPGTTFKVTLDPSFDPWE